MFNTYQDQKKPLGRLSPGGPIPHLLSYELLSIPSRIFYLVYSASRSNPRYYAPRAPLPPYPAQPDAPA